MTKTEEDIKSLQRLHDSLWHERALLTEKIHNDLVGDNPNHELSGTAVLLSKKRSWIYEQLQIARACRINPELRNLTTRRAVLEIIRRNGL